MLGTVYCVEQRALHCCGRSDAAQAHTALLVAVSFAVYSPECGGSSLDNLQRAVCGCGEQYLLAFVVLRVVFAVAISEYEYLHLLCHASLFAELFGGEAGECCHGLMELLNVVKLF